MDIGLPAIVALCVAALGAGIAKSGVPGLVTVLTPFVAMAMPARQATGILLPLLILADLLAVAHWRRRAVWTHLLKILPWALAGTAGGFFLLRAIDDVTFKPILGAIIILITIVGILRKRFNATIKPGNKVLAAVVGVLAGLFSMLANAAAPLIAMYLLSLDLDKEDFVGTNAWFFFIVNIAKLPFSLGLGIITPGYLALDAAMIPLVLAGGALGVALVKRIPQRTFSAITQALALIAGARLLLS